MKPFLLPDFTLVLGVTLSLSLGLAGCGALESGLTHGYISQEGALEQVPVGSSKEQVQFVLGSPSTTSSIDGEVYYYISQQVERSPIMGVQVKDQHVLAIYFDKNQRVSRIANYGLSDGKVIDMVSRKTPTGGKEVTFLQQIFNAISKQ
jgi:outer membrane protein assembly factor BamE (lipoprotein component of BamABCDE complex)